ncbi:MAG: penicillin-binding transpeptidase domain-containing protein, partial [Parcubacteria group bacterium]
MSKRFLRLLGRKIKGKYKDIDPEDIFLDSTNLPGFDTDRFEGRIEEPIGWRTFSAFKVILLVVAILLSGQLINLQVIKGEQFKKISLNNALTRGLIFANRGVIMDRNGVELATNAVRNSGTDFSVRLYTDLKGFAHTVGYLKYPSKDSLGFYYDTEYKGVGGAEKIYNHILTGKNGLKITETNALGIVISESVLEEPEDGRPVTLSLDADLTHKLYSAMEAYGKERGFTGGAGVIMDVETGELIALTSYPEYDANVITDGKNKDAITALLKDPANPFLNRVVSGLYTPGSILKPIVAMAALNEGIITPEKQIYSKGFISIPNPYDPTKSSIFRDWKAHGWTDMRSALAVSSDTYFYAIGGGYEDQRGLGITNINKYFRLFGIDTKTGIELPGESVGLIATPEWKAEKFDGDIWRLGDTYIATIGQYGTQITPLEAVRMTAALANSGSLLVPSIVKGGLPELSRVSGTVNLPERYFQIVREGMREAVTDGTALLLSQPHVTVAAKTGTAELGVRKDRINSWSVGFFPYENPRYAFAVIMERGPAENTLSASYVMRQVLDYMATESP